MKWYLITGTIFYILSIGPTWWIADRLGYPKWLESFVLAFYMPIGFVCDNWELAEKITSAYIDLWISL